MKQELRRSGITHVHMKANKTSILNCKLLNCNNGISSANNPVWKSVQSQGG